MGLVVYLPTPFLALMSAQPPASDSHSIAASAARAMLLALSNQRELSAIITNALLELTAAMPINAAAVACQVGRDWNTLAFCGATIPLPAELISDSIDQGKIQTKNLLAAAPLTPASVTPMALVVQLESENDQQAVIQSLGEISRTLSSGIDAASFLVQLAKRCSRLEQMLRIGAQWSREEDVDRLLEAIAETAAKLLGAERASIFLWDRPRHKLVGRPALGVAGNQLEVDDSAGIVGAVLQSGQPRRWHVGDDGETEINRSVDRKLKFKTHSLLAVPLWDPEAASDLGLPQPQTNPKATPKRTPIGVFEVINRIDGQFSSDDESALAELATQAAAAIQNTQVRQSLLINQDRLVSSAAEASRVVGEHPSMVAVRTTAERVAETDLSVLILGENGTGKEVLARSIHFGSPRRHQPFIAVNCAALVETLLESELFGHEKGAFTDAQQTRQGKFELADGGTLFLDEVGDLSAGGQAKLLRVLEERKVVRVGGSNPINVDVRVIAATNQPLMEMVRDKKFREDLFFRLNIVTLNLPPLRQRDKDIITLAEHFLSQFSQQVGRKLPHFSESAKSALCAHPWPGNIRELRNLVERVCYLCANEIISTEDLALNTATMALQKPNDGQSEKRWTGKPLSESTKEFQVEQIEQAIAICRGNMTDAASRLGLHRSNLYRKMRQLGMDTGDETL